MFATLLISYFSPSLFCNASPLNPSFFISKLGVPTIFLLSSLNLPAASLLSSLLNPINIPIQLISLLIIPLLNILLSKTLYPLLFPPPLIKGLLILAALPTTVNMCIALTTNANASTPTAVTNAVLGNLLGVIVTPLWFAYVQSSHCEWSTERARELTATQSDPSIPSRRPKHFREHELVIYERNGATREPIAASRGAKRATSGSNQGALNKLL